jgi:hypothetical protein
VDRLDDPPDARNPIARDEWRSALGDVKRAGDWSAFFRRELNERPWRDALEIWAPRLSPGIMAGATHGILRTAHAVRGLSRDETPQRTAELAEGLAYWAARYQELPSAAPEAGTMTIIDALDRLPIVDPSKRGRFLIFEAVRAVDAETFAPAINLVDTSVELDTFVRDVTRTFARVYLAHADVAAIAFIHTVTAPSALRLLAPHLTSETARAAMRYVWQACAAVFSAFGDPSRTPPHVDEARAFDAEDLIDRAVAARDEHTIKFTEACLREHAISGDPVFVAAAEDVVARLRAG